MKSSTFWLMFFGIFLTSIIFFSDNTPDVFTPPPPKPTEKKIAPSPEETTPKEKLELTEKGLNLIPFGTSEDEAHTILRKNDISFASGGISTRVKALVLNDVNVDIIYLEFEDDENVGLYKFEFLAESGNWEGFSKIIKKIKDNFNKLLGEPSVNISINKEKMHREKLIVNHEWATEHIKVESQLNTLTDGGYKNTVRVESRNLEEKVDKISEENALKYGWETERLTPAGRKIYEKYPYWKWAICNKVASKQIDVGMTKEQVREAWGNPCRVMETKTYYGTSEQWVMDCGLPTSYVYFENGICTSIQY